MKKTWLSLVFAVLLLPSTGYTQDGIGTPAGASGGASLSTPSTLTDLTATTTAAGTDLLYIVVDPGGTPLSRKITVGNLFTSPTLVTPVLGVASLTRATFTGADPVITLADGTLIYNNSPSGGAGRIGFWAGGLIGLNRGGGSASQVILYVDNGNGINLTSGNSAGTVQPGLVIYNPVTGVLSSNFIRDSAAGIMAQVNGANAQTFRIYNTFTDASNYERFKSTWSTDVLRLGTENAGTGTARVMTLDYGGTTTAAISIPITSGDITFGGVLAPTGYKSSDGTAGATTTCTIVGLTSITVKNGLITGCT